MSSTCLETQQPGNPIYEQSHTTTSGVFRGRDIERWRYGDFLPLLFKQSEIRVS